MSFCIKYMFFQMHPNHLSDDQITCSTFLAEMDHILDHTFELGRGLGHPGRLDHLRGKLSETCFLELVHSPGIFRRGEAHLLDHVVAHYVDDHLLGLHHVLQGVLDGIIPDPAGR